MILSTFLKLNYKYSGKNKYALKAKLKTDQVEIINIKM